MKANLSDLNIFALRDLARRTGVASPTSKTKGALIKEITDIMEGRQNPAISEKRKGRPPKLFGYNVMNVLGFESDSSAGLSRLSLNQVSEQIKSEEVITVAGTLELVGGNAGLLWVNKNLLFENYFVPIEVLSRAKYRTGDRIVAKVSGDENQKIVKSIYSINDIPILKMSEKRLNYLDFEPVLQKNDLKFVEGQYKDLQIKAGQNCYFYGADNNSNSMLIIDMLNSVECENKIYVNLSVAEKNKIFLKQLNMCELFTSGIADDVDVARRIVGLVIERVKRILETKESVVIAVDDMLTVDGVDNEKINLVRNLASLAKSTKSGSAITLLAVMPSRDLKFIEKLADQRYKIVGTEIIKVED